MATQQRDEAATREQAAFHRRRAGELYAAHAREEDADKARSLLDEAKQENEKAEGFEDKAKKLLERFSPAREGEAETAQKDGYTERRSWVLPGTVSDDALQQVEEANHGTLAGNILKYAGRSVIERDGAAVTWTKDKAKAVFRRFGKSPDQAPAHAKAHEKPQGLEKA